jgi:hypothetical protein
MELQFWGGTRLIAGARTRYVDGGRKYHLCEYNLQRLYYYFRCGNRYQIIGAIP